MSTGDIFLKIKSIISKLVWDDDEIDGNNLSILIPWKKLDTNNEALHLIKQKIFLLFC